MNLNDIIKMHQAGQLDVAERAYLQWLQENDEEHHFVWNKLGSLYFAQQKWQESVKAYQQAIICRSDYLDAYYNLGLALARSHLMEQALVTWRALLELSPNHAGANFQIGCFLMRDHQYEEALRQFAIIKHEETAYEETQANMAACYFKLGQLKEAKKYYLRVLDSVKEDAQTFYNIGVICAQLGNLAEAVDYYLRAVAADDNFFAAYNNLGAVYLGLKKRDKAEEYFKEALRIQPGNEGIRHTLAFLQQEKGVSTSPAVYISSLFDSYAEHYDAHLAQSLEYQVPVKMYEMMHDVLALPKHHYRILDLGCGTGLCGQYFRGVASELTGVDLSERMLDVARRKKLYDKLSCSDAQIFLQQQKCEYDLVLAGDVLVYMGDLKPLFDATHHALKPSGYFIFNVEATDEKNFHLTATGRFAHHKSYIDKLIVEQRFQMLAFRIITLRTQDGQPVRGYLYLVQAV